MSLVQTILDDIKEGGLAAALRYTEQFDHVTLRADEVIWHPLAEPPAEPPPAHKDAIDFAVAQITRFHEATRPAPVVVEQAPGLRLTEQYAPLGRAGIYVPNGEFPLISSLLMTGLPARVAGVPELVVAIAPRGEVRKNPLWLYALQQLQVDTVISLGGAQAIGLMGYGAPELPPVDLIAGPGNRYVAEAKQELFRRQVVGIDLVAGPSEVLVIASPGADPEIAAMDLLAQAEHAADARAYFVTWDAGVLRDVQAVVANQAGTRPTGTIEWHQAATPDEAVEWANRIAPEHLGLMGPAAEALLPRITRAGAVFVGRLAGQALGDYVAGPSHVLPTGGTARFLSGLSTRTFMRKTSIIEASEDMPAAYLQAGQVLAEIEGLWYHQQSLAVRARREAVQ